MSTTDVDDVCTDAHLVAHVGQAELDTLIPEDWSGSAENARQFALDEILDGLTRRQPPIEESDLDDITQLRRAVIYGALALLYRRAMNRDLDAFGVKESIYRRLYQAERESLVPSVSGGARVPVASYAIERR